MCGIVGVLGTHEVSPIIVEALRRLEYRGYDSAGIATIQEGGVLDRRRAVGKLVNLSDELVHNPLPGKAGIGHTRWATHGGVTVPNAHPHKAGRVALVHNGIIENFATFRAELEAGGYACESQTDTETVAGLVNVLMDQGMTPVEAVRAVLPRLEGAYSLLFLFEGEDDLMIAARKNSPLAIGHGDGEMYVGSDAIALASMTDRVTYLEEGDWAVITRAGATIYDEAGKLANREVRKVALSATRIEKAGYKHFMMKEIAEQPTVVDAVFDAYLTPDGDAITMDLPGVDFTKVSRVSIVACGTAYYAGLVAKYWFERYARLPVDLDVASEFRYREPPFPDGTLSVFVSQSGETADTLAALRYSDGKAAKIVSLVNSPESSIARESDVAVAIHAGVEVSVASTKAFTAMLATFVVMVLKAAVERGEMDADTLAERLTDLRKLPGLMSHAISIDGELSKAARKVAQAHDVLFLGRGQMFPLALEGALKLKEISYLHAEGYASGELKHGPIALVDKETPTVVLAPHDGLFEKTVSNMQEVMARGGRVLLISDARAIAQAGGGVWRTITMPDAPELIQPILYAIPAQLLAYHAAIAKGTDVDQPRNLAKSVTVE
ncbi:glucosamine--fructose-6-phosphate aminotransferase (isomerizing) [Maritimibacter alkaliphilus HTCC2654]|uniref:Glutamine--fructose-6-phosphate aminotransferase [isomerizing] n=1 Tax=Maritimibacter alkaliphilus HTCC2654 TaxID=314271 RepID=A3VI70_9RHOB|nr:glutamine--fructose-6-phosphate transaminase (isomerizing) [Maritimibacter alkaliphilus]EAQ12069.1 D-fructose-6-phosphate amidotransferase [Rhodobacterales bacterium HTCC2654] [Maritimibacter alkaliphilus HTCC2654]TYP83120.1 glucosamine--fructose-6-phosphate aminotransferase (isomerizing) [Maritimibacter alkaliphilus HTCC2654]